MASQPVLKNGTAAPQRTTAISVQHSSDAVTSGGSYAVYTGGTQVATVTAGQHSGGMGGMGGGPGGRRLG